MKNVFSSNRFVILVGIILLLIFLFFTSNNYGNEGLVTINGVSITPTTTEDVKLVLIDDLKKKLSDLIDQVTNKNQKLLDLQKKINKINDQIKALDNIAYVPSNENAIAMDKLQTDINSLNNELKQLYDCINTNSYYKYQCKKKIPYIQSQIDNLRMQFQGLQTENEIRLLEYQNSHTNLPNRQDLLNTLKNYNDQITELNKLNLDNAIMDMINNLDYLHSSIKVLPTSRMNNNQGTYTSSESVA